MYADLQGLIGNAENPGRLQELEHILNAVPPAVLGLTREALLGHFEAARNANDELARIVDKLGIRSSQVSFKDL